MRVKGAVVRPMVEWFAATCGESALPELAGSLAPELARELSPNAPALGILPAGWYSELLASELSEAIVKRATGAVQDGTPVRHIGRVIVDRSLGRIARAGVEWFATPNGVARYAPTFWRMYHEAGAVIAEVDGKQLKATCTGWTEHGTTWCKVVGSSAVRVMELAGCQEVRLWVHKCNGGAAPCTMIIRWSGVG
jgi:hypothetical protein